MRAEHAVDDAVDMVGPGSRGQPDGEADVGVSQDSNETPQDAQHDEDDEGRQVEHARSRQRPPDRGKDGFRGRDHERAERRPASRVEPRQQDPAKDEQPDGKKRDLEEVADEDAHEPSLPAIAPSPGRTETAEPVPAQC